MKILKTANYEKLSGIGSGLLSKLNPFGGNNAAKTIADLSSRAAQLANEIMNYDEMLPASLMPVANGNTSIKEAQGMPPNLIALMDKVKSFRDNLTQAKRQFQGSFQSNIIDNFLNRTMNFGQIMSNPDNHQGYMDLAMTVDAFSNDIKDQFDFSQQ